MSVRRWPANVPRTLLVPAAEEAAVSRLDGGIPFRSAIEDGLAQGEAVGAACVDALVPVPP